MAWVGTDPWTGAQAWGEHDSGEPPTTSATLTLSLRTTVTASRRHTTTPTLTVGHALTATADNPADNNPSVPGRMRITITPF